MSVKINVKADVLVAMKYVIDHLGDDTDLEPWKARAACRAPDVNPEWFFPDSSRPTTVATRMARGVCAGCPVRVACLDFALRRAAARTRNGERVELDGIVAGTTLAQRRATRHMGHEQAMAVLLDQARKATTTGTWRSAEPHEYREDNVEQVG